MKPDVTIGIPCFNQAHYLHECLDCLLESTHRNWEAVVVDDASTEGNVAAVVKKYKDTRIRLIRHDCNRGLAAARNTAFAAGAADLLLPLDSDDCLAPQFLARTVDVLLGSLQVECVFTDYALFGSETGTWSHSVRSREDLVYFQTIPGGGTLMRREVWERAGGYCEDRILCLGNEDWDFWIAAGPVTAMHLPEALYLYRRAPQSMSITLRYHDITTREFIYDRHRVFFDEYNGGPAFLSAGCVRSALAAKKRGEWLYAFRLAKRACSLSSDREGTIKLLVRGCIPHIVTFIWGVGPQIFSKLWRVGGNAMRRFSDDRMAESKLGPYSFHSGTRCFLS